MRQDSGHAIRYPGHYRHDLLLWRMSQVNQTPRSLSELGAKRNLNISVDTISRAISGECRTITKLWAITQLLGLNFSYLFNFDLPQSEFDRAVLNGKAARSSGSANVGVPQTRSVRRGGTYSALGE